MLLQSALINCLTQIDYSQITGERIIPFIIELDPEESVLNPGPSENQRFCYKITGVGKDSPEYANLSHLVLGICDTIPENQIDNITVFINGDEQDVEFGSNGNVQLRTPENPDPSTECPGLKFNFGLDKVGGEMNICFELKTPYPIGPNIVCLSGGGVTANQLSICGPVCEESQTCDAIGYQPLTVCVPIEVTPFAIAGTPTTYCCGEPTITPNTDSCNGTVNGNCSFTITQDICVAVPVEFGATASVSSPHVDCMNASGTDICSSCENTGNRSINSCHNCIKNSTEKLGF